jgi:hypothetical protein
MLKECHLLVVLRSKVLFLLFVALAETTLNQSIYVASVLLIYQSSQLRIINSSLGIAGGIYVWLVIVGGSLVLGGYTKADYTPQITTLVLVTVTVIVMTTRLTSRPLGKFGTEIASNHWAAWFGPGLLLSAIAFSWGRFGFLMPWAMSGDARNHIHVAREIVTSGGLRLADGYPGLTNAISALSRGWRPRTAPPELQSLKYEINSYALTILFLVVIFSVVVGQLSAPVKRAPQRLVGSLIGITSSLITLSPLLLTNLLRSGFLPVLLATTAILIAVLMLSRHKESVGIFIFVGVSLPLLLSISFPPALPLSVAILAVPLTYQLRFARRHLGSRTKSLVVASVGPVLFGLTSQWMPFRSFVARRLDQPGSITPTSEIYLVVLTIVLVILSLMPHNQLRMLSLSGVAIGFAGQSTVLFLDGALQHPYYVDKLRWLATVVCLVLVLTSVPGVRISHRQNEYVNLFCSIAALTTAWLPIIQKWPGRNEIHDLLTGWNRPTTSQAQLITVLNQVTPRSMAWRLSDDYVANQLINMWLLIGISDEDEVILWPFQADVSSITQVCAFARLHAPMTIWTPSREMAGAVTQMCEDERVAGRSITELREFGGL